MKIKMYKVKQKFNSFYLENVESTVKQEIDKLNLKIKKGHRIAITAGSRGIDRIPLILRAAVEKVKELGGEPFLVPAMGSHGGATAEGQKKILCELGITPDFVGAPVLSSMEVVKVGTFSSDITENGKAAGFSVVIDKNAYEADGIVVINRVKPHTSFQSNIESGMMKMIAIGLGKRMQAENIHSFGTEGLRQFIAPVARKILETGKIIAGIGIVENAYDRVMEIKAFLPEDIEQGDMELLQKARKTMPKLPVDQLDILIVERLGKNISGTGMDTNVIGRMKIHGEPEPDKPAINRIIVLDLTPETKGNAYGIGLADFTTKALVEKIDYKATYTNAITSTFTERVKIPIVAENEEEAFEMAVKACGIRNPETLRAIRIKNTLQLVEIWVSSVVYNELQESG
ncbi:MAG: DUF362 domain-containing protein [Clostridiaceae bacterium]|nr:DUF362 domain-containing protein [Clostridiaceae bacterium]